MDPPPDPQTSCVAANNVRDPEESIHGTIFVGWTCVASFDMHLHCLIQYVQGLRMMRRSRSASDGALNVDATSNPCKNLDPVTCEQSIRQASEVLQDCPATAATSSETDLENAESAWKRYLQAHVNR